MRQIPIDHFKLNKSYLENIDVNRNYEVIIQAISMIAHGLNLEVVAEGVEKEYHIEFLSDKQYQVGQGYYFSKPMRIEEVESFLKEKAAGERE